MRDVVGVALDDPLDPVPGGELLAVLVEMQDDGGAGLRPFGRLHLELTAPIAHPAVRLFGAGASAHHLDPIGDHERRVEADPELPDQVGPGRGFPLGVVQEPARAGTRDRAQVLLQLRGVHADAGVGDRQGGALAGVELDIDARHERKALVVVLGQGEVLELVQRVGGVGDQFAQEDLPLRVQRVRDQVEELGYLGLESLLGHRSKGSTPLRRRPPRGPLPQTAGPWPRAPAPSSPALRAACGHCPRR